jgi:hypothetical protein
MAYAFNFKKYFCNLLLHLYFHLRYTTRAQQYYRSGTRSRRANRHWHFNLTDKASLNVKVTWWLCSSLLLLRHHFLPLMTMPNKETAKFVVKRQRSKYFHFLLKFDLDIEVKVKWPYSHNVSFASGFPTHQTGCWYLIKWLRYRDLCEHDLTSISRSLLRHVKLFLQRLKGSCVALTNL